MAGPRFWDGPPHPPAWTARFLSPVAAVFAKIQARKHRRTGAKSPVPVIAIDQLTDDTDPLPTMVAIIQMLQIMGRQPAVVLRQPRAAQKPILRVDPARHTASDLGGAPLLLTAFAPVWVGENRADLAVEARAEGADVLVTDGCRLTSDMGADFTVMTVDAARGFGNGRCWPSGPLNTDLATGLKHADVVLTIGPQGAQKRFDALWSKHIPVPHLTAQLGVLQTGMDWQDMPVLAFAGTAHRAAHLVQNLRQIGADVTETQVLSANDLLSPVLLHRLEASAAMKGAQLITTEADATRLPPAFQQKVITLPIRLEFDNRAALQTLLRDCIE